MDCARIFPFDSPPSWQPVIFSYKANVSSQLTQYTWFPVTVFLGPSSFFGFEQNTTTLRSFHLALLVLGDCSPRLLGRWLAGSPGQNSPPFHNASIKTSCQGCQSPVANLATESTSLYYFSHSLSHTNHHKTAQCYQEPDHLGAVYPVSLRYMAWPDPSCLRLHGPIRQLTSCACSQVRDRPAPAFNIADAKDRNHVQPLVSPGAPAMDKSYASLFP